jgi:AcrR family transcriptional regulator
MDAPAMTRTTLCFEMTKKLSSDHRRLQILKVAEPQFASTGLHATTTLALAKAAGISEAILYVHFGSKESLFKEAVEGNIANRLKGLRDRLGAIPRGTPAQCVESMAEITVMGSASDAGNALLLAWALLETPKYAAELYRDEISAARAMWESEIVQRFPESPERTRLAVHFVPYAVNACLAFGFWLATLRHTPTTAAQHARQYATGIGQAASAILSVATSSGGA